MACPKSFFGQNRQRTLAIEGPKGSGIRAATGMKVGARMASQASSSIPSIYVSPKELAARWRCARSTVDLVARRAGFTRLCLGEGRNGMVRYVLAEVEAYEQSRQVVMAS